MSDYRPKSTLEQWRMLQAVVDYGGYAQAAEKLNKSQSSLNHAVAKLQQQLGTQLLEVRGRKAHLTTAGEALLRHSRNLTQQVTEIEQLADNMNQGWEPEIRMAVEIIYPKEKLWSAMEHFYPQSRGTRIQITDEVITGTEEAITQGKVDVAISGMPPKGYLGEYLCTVEFVLVAGPTNPMVENTIEQEALKHELQIVIRDTAQQPKEKFGWLKADKRWTVSNFYEAKSILQRGLGFCWMPTHMVEKEIRSGELKQVQVKGGSKRAANLYLIIPKPQQLGPSARLLANSILAEHNIDNKI